MSTKNACIARIAFSVISALAVFSTSAFAQSSGNFAASVQTTQCTMNTSQVGSPGSLNNNGGGMLLKTNIQTPASKYTTLLITPSLVTGLFNNTQVTSGMPTSANSAAVVIKVTLDGNPVLPETSGSPSVIYDQRFQYLSAPVFSQLMACAMNNQCSIDLTESTLSAHSFNFVATNVGGGSHALEVDWAFVCTDSNGAATPCTMAYTANSAGACAGPGTITVTQTKAFTQSGGIVVQ